MFHARSADLDIHLCPRRKPTLFMYLQYDATVLNSGNNFLGSQCHKEQRSWCHLMESKFELIDDDFHQSVQEVQREQQPTNNMEMKLQSDTVDQIDYKGQRQHISTKSSDSELINPLKLMVLEKCVGE